MNCESGHECGCGGCGPGTGDCCGGVQRLTPRRIYNRPGLTTLDYRVGTYAGFYASMQARLATMEVDGIAADGQTPLRLRPLAGLTTRDKGPVWIVFPRDDYPLLDDPRVDLLWVWQLDAIEVR